MDVSAGIRLFGYSIQGQQYRWAHLQQWKMMWNFALISLKERLSILIHRLAPTQAINFTIHVRA